MNGNYDEYIVSLWPCFITQLMTITISYTTSEQRSRIYLGIQSKASIH